MIAPGKFLLKKSFVAVFGCICALVGVRHELYG